MPTAKIYVKPCVACGAAFETTNRRDRLCSDCRLDRQLDRINNYYWRKKARLCAARTAEARSWTPT